MNLSLIFLRFKVLIERNDKVAEHFSHIPYRYIDVSSRVFFLDGLGRWKELGKTK
jgi:hypothetical protein